MPFVHPFFEYGRAAVKLRPLPVVLLAVIGNVAALLGPLIVGIISAFLLAWFVLSELAGKKIDAATDEARETRRDERVASVIRAAISENSAVDARGRAIIETIRLSDQINVFLHHAEVRAKSRLVGREDASDEENAAIIDAENKQTVELFNTEFYERVRQVWSAALDSMRDGSMVAYSVGFAAVLHRGAWTVADIHETYAALDDAARQIIHGSY